MCHGAKASGKWGRAVLLLDAMWQFDSLVASGVADQGDIQNGKGDFFNDFLSALLTVCSGKEVHTRPNVAGLSFANHKARVPHALVPPVPVPVTPLLLAEATQSSGAVVLSRWPV